jgi:long-chain acyl-CoA synthetase
MSAFLFERIRTSGEAMAVAEPSGTCTYQELDRRIAEWTGRLEAAGVPRGSIVSIEGDYGREAVSAFVALLAHDAIIVPLSRDSAHQRDSFLEIGEVEWRISAGDVPSLSRTGRAGSHAFYQTLRERAHPGLVLFSSGSSGLPKAAVHDLALLLKKFQTPRHAFRTLVFLQLDHIGGVNTLLYTLANGGGVVVAGDRSPKGVCETIAQHRAELLPTSPTFLNLLLVSEEYQRHDLSSLKLITYGTEPMPTHTLQRANDCFPDVRFLQTYGMTELGILRSQSRDDRSLWVRVGGEGFETKVTDGRLWIRAESAMLGYLNAPSPFDEEGFFDTGDLVETDGQWVRFLGRKSDVINVGGTKVFPAEVEAVLLEMENVEDAVVFGEKNAISGQTVVATVRLQGDEDMAAFKIRMRRFCLARLAPYKVPTRVVAASGPLHTARFKRSRRTMSAEAPGAVQEAV